MMILFQPARRPSARAEKKPASGPHPLTPFGSPLATTEIKPLYNLLFSLGARKQEPVKMILYSVY